MKDIKLKLVPRRAGNYIDVIEIRSGDDLTRPEAVVYINTFWSSSGNQIYDKLIDGEDIVVKLEIVEEE